MLRNDASPTRVVLVGTGTGVGKTHVACALLRAWSARGEDAVGLKPIETGVDLQWLGSRASGGGAAVSAGATSSSGGDPVPESADPRDAAPASDGSFLARVARSDFERLARAVIADPGSHAARLVPATQEPSSACLEGAETFHVKRPASNPREPSEGARTFHVKPPLYAFPDPISPHLAAHRAGTRIELAAIRRWVLEHSRTLTLVETAGGLFSPLDHSVTNLDVFRALLPARLLLIAPDRLGVLHDVTATVGFARASGLPIKGLVLSAPDPPDASTGHNASAIEALGLARVVASFPRADEADISSRAAAEKVIAWLTGRDGA